MLSSDDSHEPLNLSGNDDDGIIAPSLKVKADEETTPSASNSSSKKRQSDIQLDKNSLENDQDGSDEDDGDDLNDEGGKRSDPFSRASSDVLKNRKIVKASSKWSVGNTVGTNAGGTFASIRLTHTQTSPPNSEPGANSSVANKVEISGSTAGNCEETISVTAKNGSIFGSGFGNVSHGFGSIKSSSTAESDHLSTKVNVFGGGFSSISSGFGSLKSSSTATVFGSVSQPNNTSSIATTNFPPSTKINSFSDGNTCLSKFPMTSTVDTDNGEQDEDCSCQVRAKLFKMVPDDESPVAGDESITKSDVPSVPSTTGRMESVKTQKNHTNKDTGEEDIIKGGATEKGNGKKLIQKEAGIGPVRILRNKAGKPLTARVVQRQETSGGGATRVILNIRLSKESCTVIRRGDKFVQLNAPSKCGSVESFLFKVKTTAEADTLENAFNDVLGLSGKDIV